MSCWQGRAEWEGDEGDKQLWTQHLVRGLKDT